MVEPAATVASARRLPAIVDSPHARGRRLQNELTEVLVTEEQILAKLDEIAAQVAADYAGKNLLLVGVLKGAVMVMADFSRALPTVVPMDWMAVSSYGAGTKSSGVVQIRKDLDNDLHDSTCSSSRTSSTRASPSAGCSRTSQSAARHPSRSSRCCASPSREGAGRLQVRRLRHPERVRRRLRPRLRREVPQPAGRRDPRAARLRRDRARADAASTSRVRRRRIRRQGTEAPRYPEFTVAWASCAPRDGSSTKGTGPPPAPWTSRRSPAIRSSTC